MVAAILQGTGATWVHCGDSRLYVVRDGERETVKEIGTTTIDEWMGKVMSGDKGA